METTTVETATTKRPSVRDAFKKYVKYATAIGAVRYDVVASITWDGTRLSFTGVEGPLTSGDCRGSCGQVRVQEYHQPVNGVDLVQFSAIWDRWHRNDLRAGTTAQMEYLRDNGGSLGYDSDCKRLETVGLLFDGDYRYGSSWLMDEVPDEVLVYLRSLPEYDALPDAWR